MQKKPKFQVKNCIGDFNGKTGSANETQPHIVSSYGKHLANSNGDGLIGVAEEKHLIIVNTHSHHEYQNKVTRQSTNNTKLSFNNESERKTHSKRDRLYFDSKASQSKPEGLQIVFRF